MFAIGDMVRRKKEHRSGKWTDEDRVFQVLSRPYDNCISVGDTASSSWAENRLWSEDRFELANPQVVFDVDDPQPVTLPDGRIATVTFTDPPWKPKVGDVFSFHDSEDIKLLITTVHDGWVYYRWESDLDVFRYGRSVSYILEYATQKI